MSGDFEEFFWRYVVENVGGFISGSVAVVFGQPFDTIKVRQQAGKTKYSGSMDCLRQTVRQEGTRALFKGTLSPLVANSAMNALTFSSWEEAQRFLHFTDGDSSAPLEKVFAAGAFAGVVQCAVATPMELVRSKLQVQHNSNVTYRGNLDCIRQIYKAEVR
eukprot:SAG31_NODE_1581_length_7834_cov_11.737298_6_plen_161_part_00